MTDHGDELGNGEIRRGFERIEKQLASMQTDVQVRYLDLANKMNVALAPISEVRFRCDRSEKDLGDLATKVRVNEGRIANIEVRAAGIAGGITAVVLLVKFLVAK